MERILSSCKSIGGDTWSLHVTAFCVNFYIFETLCHTLFSDTRERVNQIIRGVAELNRDSAS
jgi:hypothetical protein